MSEVIEGEIVEEHGTDLEVRPASSPTLFGTSDPVEVIEGATRIATPLAGIVRKQGLAVNIQGREHVKVEGWTLLGSMLGVFPVIVWTRKMENGWEARCEARTRDGAIIGAAEAECTRDENQWSLEPTGRNGKKLQPRDDYALRSMAQTRATSKALRMPLGFVMELAGFAATPAEEMPTSSSEDTRPAADADCAADVVIHFGKNSGKRLSELTKNQIEWYAQKWEPNPEYANETDKKLKAAALELHLGIPAGATVKDDLGDVPF